MTHVNRYLSTSISVRECKRRLGLDSRLKYVAIFGKENISYNLAAPLESQTENIAACGKVSQERKNKEF